VGCKCLREVITDSTGTLLVITTDLCGIFGIVI
jgi:hypothetical protein